MFFSQILEADLILRQTLAINILFVSLFCCQPIICFFMFTDVTPAGQQLLGHGVLPRGLGAAHAGGHRVL